jgi:signal transduction histidine kinase/ActR/RegA family two-component response regulator
MRVRLRRKDCSLFWAELHIKKVTDAHQDKVCLDGMVQDISLQIEAQNEKKRLENQLRQAQKMETIGTLAGGIAHDFNNILASITGYSELVLEDSQHDTIQRENIKCVLIAARRAADLVGQILTFARQTDTEKIAVKVHVVLEEALKLLHSILPSTIKIEKHIRTTSSVMAAPSQLHQVIVNLCSNASHAMQSTGGVLTIELAELELDQASLYAGHLVSGGPYAKIRISDTGHGMAPDIMERIFDPYFTTKKPGEGTGIGLSVVQGIVREHGGFLSAASHPGKGATFNVFLPCIDNKDLPRTAQDCRIVGGNERILLVDDENNIVNMGQQILEGLGYRVTPYSKAAEAFELFKASPDQFDLVIADITMPQMTGDLLATKITAIRPDIPIILWTGYTDRLDQIVSSKSGASAIVYKPLSKSKLAETIREVLSRHNRTW